MLRPRDARRSPVPISARSRVHRADLKQLVVLANRDLEVYWRQFDSADVARDGLRDILPELVRLYGAAAATLAADWYEDLRDEVGVPGSFTAIPAELPDTSRTDALARWAVGALYATTPDFQRALTAASGGLQRVIADADRQTVMLTSVEDPGAKGWQREGAGGCAFCQMLIGRGAVYSEASADFGSHDHCNCTAVPAFDGEPKPVREYTPTDRNITDADRARVRDWLSDH